MNSLEALQFIIDMFNKYAQKPNDIGLFFKFCEAHDKVLKDLERLEQLEKENQELIVNKNVAQAVAFDQKREIGELKDQISYLKEDGEEWQSAYEWSQTENSILKLENEKLHKDYGLLDITMESDDRIICELLKEKEQLKNDIELNEAQIDDLTLEVANYKHALEEKNEIIMDLKEDLRLTTIERTNCEDIWEEEHQKCCQLEKALDKACEMIAICPPNVNVEECEKVENECKECWKKYLLSEVLENE